MKKTMTKLTPEEYRTYTESPKAFELFTRRFIHPWSPLLALSGYDGIGQMWQNDSLTSITFPLGFTATMNRTNDISAAQHEAGHFISVPEHRTVRPSFGFHGGIPSLGFYGLAPLPTKPNSADVEARAMAWEVILMRDLHGIEVDPATITSSLTFASDFWLYEGATNSEKLAWATGKVSRYVTLFGTIDDFERLWVERCEKLPELMRRETIRSTIFDTQPVETITVESIVDNWAGQIHIYTVDDVQQAAVTIFNPSRPDLPPYDDSFDTKHEAIKFLERVKASYAD